MGYGECGNGRREGGGPDNVIPHAALQIFNNCCCYYVFFPLFFFCFHCFLFGFFSIQLFLRIEGLIILFHTPFSRFSTIVAFIVIVISLFSLFCFSVFLFGFYDCYFRGRGHENVNPHAVLHIFNNLLLLFSLLSHLVSIVADEYDGNHPGIS